MTEQAAFLRAAVDIGHLGARVGSEDALVEAVADLLRQSFGLVAVQVYLVDASGLFGELRHHAGKGDRKTLVRTPGVPVGSDSGLGEVLGGGRARRVLDMHSLPRNAVPAGVQVGLALPLNVEGQVLGALMLYASEGDAFPDSEVGAFGALADMAALALESVRGRAEGRRKGTRPLGELVLRRGVAPSPPGVEQPLYYAIGSEEELLRGDSHTAPIRLRGSVIGSMTFGGPEKRELEADEKELIESVADQVAQAVENLKLLEGAQRLAVREQLINEITAQLQRATSVDQVLRAAAEAVRAALGDVKVTARLSPEVLASGLEADPAAEEDEAE